MMRITSWNHQKSKKIWQILGFSLRRPLRWRPFAKSNSYDSGDGKVNCSMFRTLCTDTRVSPESRPRRDGYWHQRLQTICSDSRRDCEIMPVLSRFQWWNNLQIWRRNAQRVAAGINFKKEMAGVEWWDKFIKSCFLKTTFLFSFEFSRMCSLL